MPDTSGGEVKLENDRTAKTLRIAFFITAYRPPDQLTRLVNTLRHAEPDTPIVIHHDSFTSPLDHSLFDSMSNVHLLTSESPILWGDLSLDIARWQVFRWILNSLDVDWVVLLSEQDYPIAPLGDLRKRMAHSGVDAFISGQRVNEIEDRGFRRNCTLRYLYQYSCLPNVNLESRLPPRLRKFVAKSRRLTYSAINASQRTFSLYGRPVELHLPSWIGIRARRTPFSPDFPCWYHDSWFVISSKADSPCARIRRFAPRGVHYYEHTIIPVESVTGTIVFNDSDLRVANIALHEKRWTNPESGHPDVFKLEDLDFLLSSNANFARKFDLTNSDILDALDRIVLA